MAVGMESKRYSFAKLTEGSSKAGKSFGIESKRHTFAEYQAQFNAAVDSKIQGLNAGDLKPQDMLRDLEKATGEKLDQLHKALD